MQPSFRSLAGRSARLVAAAALFAAIAAVGLRLDHYRSWGPQQPFAVALEEVALDRAAPRGWRLAGAWRLDHRYLRLSGMSGLAFAGDRLAAVTDHGQIVLFAPPEAGQARLLVEPLPLPAREGLDAEALVVDPDGAGGQVAYERRERIEHFVDDFRAIVAHWPVPGAGRGNRGIEAMTRLDGRLVALAETGEGFIETQRRLAPIAVEGLVAMPTGAATRGTRELLVLQRGVGLAGFRTWVASGRIEEGVIRLDPAVRLGLSRRDNAEGIALRARADGGAEIWIVTDDNRGPPQRTLLARYEMDPEGWPIRR